MTIRGKMVAAFSVVEGVAVAIMVFALLTLRSLNHSYADLLESSAAYRGLVQENSHSTTLFMVVILAGIVVMVGAGILCVRMLSRDIREPVKEMARAAHSVSLGQADVDVRFRSDNEIGELGDAFRALIDATREQADIITLMADGDYTTEITLRSERDLINHALQRLSTHTNDMLHEVRHAAEQVASASQQIAQGAQSLAAGSSQQSASVEEFSNLLDNVLSLSQENATFAHKAMQTTEQMGRKMQQSIASMQQLSQSMEAIDASSQSITRVIKVIDDIAFQTNILALNAAVEAARAGQHGKGFAVVADEVRNLASKSAEAASETAALIEESTRQVQDGQRQMTQTSQHLEEVANLSASSTSMMSEISRMSEQQKEAVDQISTGVSQIATVTHANAATSQQSAAAAQEMSSQSVTLRDIVARFQLREDRSNDLSAMDTLVPSVGESLPTVPVPVEDDSFALDAPSDKYA